MKLMKNIGEEKESRERKSEEKVAISKRMTKKTGRSEKYEIVGKNTEVKEGGKNEGRKRGGREQDVERKADHIRRMNYANDFGLSG